MACASEFSSIHEIDIRKGLKRTRRKSSNTSTTSTIAGSAAKSTTKTRWAAESLGLDAVLEHNGVPIRAFDLKTGGPMTAARRAELARRFGISENMIEELMR